MEFIKKILGLILLFLEDRRKKKEETQETRRVQVETLEKVRQKLNERKQEIVKSSTDDDFFGDKS